MIRGILVPLSVIVLLLSSGLSFSEAARLYEISEPDAFEELEREISRVKRDIRKMIPKVEIKPARVTVAKKNNIRFIDPTYCTTEDIKVPVDNNDLSKGYRTLYSKGFCFNPIDYIPVVPPRIIVFDPCNVKQVQWVEKNGKDSDMYLLANCLKYPFKNRRFVTPLTERSKKQFHIRSVISIIEVDTAKRRIRIEEVPVRDNN